MRLLIPVAKDKTGETVTPTCSKEDGPFTCLGCSRGLFLRQGDKNRWHFAHHSNDNDECSAGGESYNHLAAKLLLVRYITRFEFTIKCYRLHIREEIYQGCTAVQEHRFDGVHSADVAVFHEGNLKAIVEVRETHKTEGEPLSARISFVGGENMWEVEAMRVLQEQRQLSLTTNTVRLPSLLKVKDCAKCVQETELMRKQKEQRVEKMEYEKRKAEELRRQRENPVVIIDDNTWLRNNVLMKKVLINPGDWFDRRYVWAKEQE